MAELNMNPTYTAYIVSGSKKYDITPAIIAIDRIDAEGQIAQRVNLQLRNVMVEGSMLSSILQPVNRLFVYADDGTKNDEVFRGFLWDRTYKSSIREQSLKVTAYDHLIYLQESEDTFYFSHGKTTEEIVSSICEQWGIKLDYSYQNIVNGKMPLTGSLYDILTADVLDETRIRTGYHYSVISEKDTMLVRTAGTNEVTYKFEEKNNVSSATSSWTMEGVVTQIVLIGKADDDDREKVEMVESRNVEKYGTLQKISRKDQDTNIWDAHAELRVSLMENSDPKHEYEITGPDIPWIRKGDGVYVDAGDINEKKLIVTAVNRSCDTKNANMTLTMVDVSTKIGLLDVDWFSS